MGYTKSKQIDYKNMRCLKKEVLAKATILLAAFVVNLIRT